MRDPSRQYLSPVAFTAEGVAAPAGSKTIGKTKDGRSFVRDSSGHRGTKWRQTVQKAARLQMRSAPPIEGPLELVIRFYVPRPKAHQGAHGLLPSAPPWPHKTRPDTTKLVRAVEDALNGLVWVDDNQVVVQHASKRYGEPARAEIHVAPVVRSPDPNRKELTP